MKKKDVILLSRLRNNARESLTSMSKETLIPVSTLYDKLRMHEGNAIVRHTTLFDFEELGFHARAFFMLKVPRAERDKLRGFLEIHPSINSLYMINNGFDVIGEGIFNDVKGLHSFIEDLEQRFGVEQSGFHFIIDDVVRERFLMDFETSSHMLSDAGKISYRATSS